MLLVTLFFILGEYKLNALSAARANSSVPKDSVLLDKVDYPWGKVFIFDSSEKPITAISFKSFGFLWVSRMSTYYFHNEDPIKTIGGTSFSDDKGRAATVFSVLLNDPTVSYLEVGPDENRLRKKAELNEPITFYWDKSIPWNDYNAKAFNENGKVLYEYRYPETNYIRIEDLKWYPVLAKSTQGD
ncbi:hypothetical protein FE784_23915 [Paenibacillus hemerocallicola]|uniref:Uncharacterized protein n=1 Tax=Paenibacillus hemerocallicola TaxID=1172614 RepID=A0A5C4T6D1_9BACL|nr:hypothetical protein [Paenibacillus hemerocallicola]TNJ63769.1 hypothetical protein FE784_23915 [Paenibacillus hemerocallicola]